MIAPQPPSGSKQHGGAGSAPTLADGKIECRVCHGRYRSLGAHLHAHGWTVEQYRWKYPEAPIHGPGARGGRPRKRKSEPQEIIRRADGVPCGPKARRQRRSVQVNDLQFNGDSNDVKGIKSAPDRGAEDGQPTDTRPEGPVSRPSATDLDGFEDPPRPKMLEIKELESDALVQWTSDVVGGWKSRHEVSRDRHALLYRFVWHALHADPDGFKLICKARVKAPKHPYQLPVRHFFTVLARSVKAEIESAMVNAGRPADTARKRAAEAVAKEVNIKSLTDYSVRIIRWAGEYRGDHADDRGVRPDAFGLWFDSQGCATTIRAAHDEKYASRKDGPTDADMDALAKAKGATSGGDTGGTVPGEEGSPKPVVRRDGDRIHLVLPRLLMLRLRRALDGASDTEVAGLRDMISEALDAAP